MMDDLTAAKTELRSRAFAARKGAHAERALGDPAANASLFAALGALTNNLSGKIVATYQAMRTEIDPSEAGARLIAAGARLCTPVIIAAGKPLRFREWEPGIPMIDGTFGAKIPAEGEWLTPDVVIAPLVGWDRSGGRLGYGGGFYDRTLEGLRSAHPTPAIGFAYAAQELANAPQEPTDQPLDMVVTETETITFSKGG